MLKWASKKGEILERIYWIEKVVAVWRSKDFLVGVYEKIWLWCDERMAGEMLKWVVLRMLKRERLWRGYIG
ncbi:MAG: hypothetical protein ACYS1A_17030 [Planctomycetota bacterium]|jgi:hypothetical protein